MHVTRRDFLAAAAKAAGAAVVALETGAACASPVVTGPPKGGDGLPATLQAHANARGVTFGSATGTQHLTLDPPFEQLVLQQSGMLAPEIELKWGFLRPTPDVFRFEMADAQLALAEANAMSFRGHTLVWHQGMPDWFTTDVTPQNAEQVLRDHIAVVAGRYAGKMQSWDVVNEPFQLSDGRPDGLRKTQWLDMLGPDYIRIAFEAAGAADPSALLLISENSLEYSYSTALVKRQKMLELVVSLRNSGVRVDGIALQGHLVPDLTFLDPVRLRSFLADAAALDLAIVISELDVSDDTLPADVAQRDAAIADAYRAFLAPVLDEPAVKTVVSWGLSDKYSWLAGFKPRSDGRAVRPLPFDFQMTPKASELVMRQAFDAAPAR
jgi:endo-1,4-beta-xylanase